MTQSTGVSRLKELLFDSESQALSDLARRIDALAEFDAAERKRLFTELSAMSVAERQERLAMLERMDGLIDRLGALDDRLGTKDRLETSVAGIIDGALRQAETERHNELADAVSPVVVRTVKTEIRNSRDELVEALYPMTGRMVKAYVASAMKDLMAEVNRKIERNPFMLRVAALLTGRSAAELALAETQRTEIEELYLIRRGTGELVGHWPDTPSANNRDQVVSGVLSALNEFASEAFSDTGRALRQIDIGPSQVYLRLSPVYLLAVRCKGSQHAAIERVIDDEFLSGLEKHAALAATHAPGEIPKSGNDELLAEVGKSLSARIAQAEAALAPPRVGAALLKSLAWLIGLPVVAWLSWMAYVNFETQRVRGIAESVVEKNIDLRGYPTHITVEPRGRVLTVSGLAPLASAKERLVTELRGALPGRDVRDQMAVVPSGLANAEPLIRAVRKDLTDLERSTSETAAQIEVQLQKELQAQMEAERRGREADASAFGAERKRLDAEITALRSKLAALEARPPPTVAAPGIRERIAAWARANAIFFGNGTDYRDPERSARQLDELAALMAGHDTVLRVVGYTDETGNAARNSTLSLSRAETVLSALVARGVPSARLVPVGRQNSIDIAPTKGAQSANRRVEFELGFFGETAP